MKCVIFLLTLVFMNAPSASYSEEISFGHTRLSKDIFYRTAVDEGEMIVIFTSRGREIEYF